MAGSQQNYTFAAINDERMRTIISIREASHADADAESGHSPHGHAAR
jgi:hypothetical protein